MKCKKHGEIGNRTITISHPVQPVIEQKSGDPIKLEIYDKGDSFCLNCLQEFLKKKIGVVTE